MISVGVMQGKHLAQVNIARMRGDLSSPVMRTLMARIEEMNQLAERSKGFVWRLPGQEITSEALSVFTNYVVPFEPELIFYNLSVWESVEDLRHYAFRTAHSEMLRDKQEWIGRFDKAHLALWWIAAGEVPTVADSATRLRSVQENGPTEFAFTFAKAVPQVEITLPKMSQPGGRLEHF